MPFTLLKIRRNINFTIKIKVFIYIGIEDWSMKNINSKINSDTKLVLASWNILGDIGNTANTEWFKDEKNRYRMFTETYHDEDICLSESDGHLIFWSSPIILY